MDHLDVVEIEECLVDWAYAGLTATLAAVANDPRAALHTADVTAVLAGRRQGPHGPWNAIVLDVDNGPDFLIHGANSALYSQPSLAAAYAQLTDGGTLAIWCQGPAPELLASVAADLGHGPAARLPAGTAGAAAVVCDLHRDQALIRIRCWATIWP